ncbi:hypothetical protein ACFYY2_14980 [Streptomyces sp. NPDC001822]|uniref:hypothetical protein n=1 Tax=Streptomyces sp. NPDC001822 TaxID=3364614 RepID=UPI0036BE5AFC
MDLYDSHHSPGSDPGRRPESPTPIYDRLLAEWNAASRGVSGRTPADAASWPQAPLGPGRRGEGAFVPAARRAGPSGGR